MRRGTCGKAGLSGLFEKGLFSFLHLISGYAYDKHHWEIAENIHLYLLSHIYMFCFEI